MCFLKNISKVFLKCTLQSVKQLRSHKEGLLKDIIFEVILSDLMLYKH